MKTLFVVALTCAMLAPAVLAQTPLASTPGEQLADIQLRDQQALLRYREGLRQAIAEAHGRPELFGPNDDREPRVPAACERESARRLWQRVLDYHLALDSIGRFHADYAGLDDARVRARSFQLARAAHLIGYRAALDFIDVTAANATIGLLLNEPAGDVGLPSGTYDRYKFRFLNVQRAAEFVALQAIAVTLPLDDGALRAAIEEDSDAIVRAGLGKGEAMTLVNGLDIVRKAGFTAWFPVQAGVAEWMGDAKVARPGRDLISPAQIREIAGRLEPGDILLERREWYLSNIGLPGFWPHAALLIGTPAERRAYFDDDAVRAWVRGRGEASGDFERLLQARFPAAYRAALEPQEAGHAPRVIEAISEGVSFTTLEHSAAADSLAVLRPRLAKVEKALAILRAFGYAGRPYDFDFDFRTDAALVCTELVYKAFEPAPDMQGLRLPLLDFLGRPATPANEIVKQFDEQFGTAQQQTDLVLFLDGREWQARAVPASVQEFRASWRRPKWHIVLR